MSSVAAISEVEIVSIRVFWRTHDEFGRIPVDEQEWWFELCDSHGGQCLLSLSDWVSPSVESITEAVVEIAEKNGITIGVEQVKTDTCKRTASWCVGY